MTATDARRKEPSPEHPILIETSTARVAVVWSGKTVADTRQALILREAAYPPVYYIPLADVDRRLLTDSSTRTYCPYKGDCNYYSLRADGRESTDAVWEYRAPYPALSRIEGHVAFYPSRVERIGEVPS